MKITLEQVEYLREKADISYALAKEALMRTGGNLLDALIWLEEAGHIAQPKGTFYSTRTEAPPPPPSPPPPAPPSPPPRAEGSPKKKKTGLLTRIRDLFLENELEVWRKGTCSASFPLLVVILLLYALPWLFLPLLVIGLFAGFRYRFSGPYLERDDLNGAIDRVAEGAEDLGHRVAQEFRSQQEQRQTRTEEAKTGGDWLDEDSAPSAAGSGASRASAGAGTPGGTDPSGASRTGSAPSAAGEEARTGPSAPADAAGGAQWRPVPGT